MSESEDENESATKPHDLSRRMRELDIRAREEDLAARKQIRKNRQRILYVVIGTFLLLNLAIPTVILLGAIGWITLSKTGMMALTGTLFPEVAGLVYIIMRFYFDE